MSLKYLLDTDILSQPLKPAPDRKIVRRLRRHQDESATASPVWHEMLFGSLRLPPSKRRKLIEQYLHEVVAATLPILSYDEAAAAWHAEERRRLERGGRVPPFVDGQIAAIAVVNGLTLVTRNRRDYNRFRDLNLADWGG